MAEEKLAGKIIHYYDKLGVAIVDLAAPLKISDQVRIKGAHNDFAQAVGQLQYEHQDIPEGKKGQQVGLKVEQKVHENDQVFLAA